MTVAVTAECPVCAGQVDVPADVVLNELLDCDECGSELEVVGLGADLRLDEAPMAEEDWGE